MVRLEWGVIFDLLDAAGWTRYDIIEAEAEKAMESRASPFIMSEEEARSL